MPTDYDSAFRAMLADPANLDLTFRFAELAMAAGDLEGAVSAFERLLIFNPDLPRIRYELGVLYMRLGSYQIARGYFEDVLRAADVPAEIRASTQADLAEIDKRLSATTFLFTAQTGVRWQSNANVANSSGVVKLFGLDATLDPGSQKQADWNAFAQAALLFTYDLGTQDRDTLEAGVQFYGTRQFEISSLDLGVMQLDLGPRLRFGGDSGWSLRPYVFGSGVNLDNTRYFVSYGAGASADLPLWPGFGLELEGKSRLRNFHVTETRTTVDDKDGWEHGARVGARYALSPVELLRGGGYLTVVDAKADFERYFETTLELAYFRQIPAPFGLTQQPWVASVGGARIFRYFDAADPTVDPFTTRKDREWSLGASLAVRVQTNWSLNLQFLQQWVKSSVSNYAYTNTSATIGLGYAF